MDSNIEQNNSGEMLVFNEISATKAMECLLDMRNMENSSKFGELKGTYSSTTRYSIEDGSKAIDSKYYTDKSAAILGYAIISFDECLSSFDTVLHGKFWNYMNSVHDLENNSETYNVEDVKTDIFLIGIREIYDKTKKDSGLINVDEDMIEYATAEDKIAALNEISRKVELGEITDYYEYLALRNNVEANFSLITEEEAIEWLASNKRDSFMEDISNSTGFELNDLKKMSDLEIAQHIASASLASVIGLAENGGYSNAAFVVTTNSYLYNIQDEFYSTEEGRQALWSRFVENSVTTHDGYNAIANTDYIKYCISTGHVDDWLVEELRGFAYTVEMININDNFAVREKIVDLETISEIEEWQKSEGTLPFNVSIINGEYYQTKYTVLGEDMLYEMDYHFNENNGNCGEDRIVTAFSNQGYMDAIERSYKGKYIEDYITNNLSDRDMSLAAVVEVEEELRKEAERDYYILNGLIEDNTRLSELKAAGQMSFSELVNGVTELTENPMYDFSVKDISEEDIEKYGLSQAQAIHNTKVLMSTLGVTTIEAAAGVFKSIENIEDAINMAIHSDIVQSIVNNEEYLGIKQEYLGIKQEYSEMCDRLWNDYISNDKLYNYQLNEYLNDQKTLSQAIESFKKTYYDPNTGSYFFEGKIYSAYEDIPLDIQQEQLNTFMINSFKNYKMSEWSLDDSSSSNIYLAAFKEGIREGGNFKTFNELDEVIVEHANEQFDVMEEVVIDNAGIWVNGIRNKNWYKNWADYSFAKQDNILGMTANQIGNMAIPVLASAVGPGLGQVLSSGLLFTSAFGGAAEESINAGGSYNQTLKYATLSASTELLIEKVFAGIAGFGEGWMDNVLSYAPNKFLEATNLTNSLAAQIAKKMLTNGMGEGIEEVVTDFVTPLWQSLTYMNDKSYSEIFGENVSLESEVETFLVSFLTSMVFGTSNISRQWNHFNNQMNNLQVEIGNILGMKDTAMKVFAEMLGSDANMTSPEIFNKIIEMNGQELAKSIAENPEASAQIQELQHKLEAAKAQMDNNQTTITVNGNEIKLSNNLVLTIADTANLNGNFELNDGNITFEDDKTKNKFIDAMYKTAKNQLSSITTVYTEEIKKYNNAKIFGDYSKLGEAIQTIVEDSVRKEGVEGFLNSLKATNDTIKIEVEGNEFNIPRSVAQEVASESKTNFDLNLEGDTIVVNNSNIKAFAKAIYTHANKILENTRNEHSEQIVGLSVDERNGKHENINSILEQMDKNSNNNQSIITSAEKVEGKDLIKLEVLHNEGGDTRKVNVYVEGSTSSNVYTQDSFMQKVNESISENTDTKNIYMGELTYNRKTNEITSQTNDVGKSYVETQNESDKQTAQSITETYETNKIEIEAKYEEKISSLTENERVEKDALIKDKEVALSVLKTNHDAQIAQVISGTVTPKSVVVENNQKTSTAKAMGIAAVTGATAGTISMATSDTNFNHQKVASTNSSINSSNSETSNIPSIVKGILVKDVVDILNSTETINSNEFIFISNAKRFIELCKEDARYLNYLNDNGKRVLNIIENLDPNSIILNINEVINGASPIYFSNTIEINGENIATDALVTILKERTLIEQIFANQNASIEIASYILKDVVNISYNVFNEFINVIIKYDQLNKLFSREFDIINRVLVEKTNYIYEMGNKGYILPKTFEGELVEELIRGINFPTTLLNDMDVHDVETRESAIKVFENFKKILPQEVLNKLNDKIDNVIKILQNEFQTFEISNQVTSSFYDVCETSRNNSGTFGAEQHKINKIIHTLGVNEVIENLCGSSIKKTEFLNTLKDMNISEDEFMKALVEHNTSSMTGQISHDIEVFKSLIEQVKQNYEGISTIDAIRFLYLVETTEAGNNGVCNVATKVNTIFNNYIGKEAQFESDFGYPMYITSATGQKVLNDARLLIDLYSVINEGVLITKEDGKYNIATTSNKYVHLTFWDKLNDDAIQQFFNKKGINLSVNSKLIIDPNSKPIHYDEFMNIVKQNLEKGISMEITADGFDLYNVETHKLKEDISSHTVTILGITQDGNLIVDSWGEKHIFNVKNELLRHGDICEISVTDNGAVKSQKTRRDLVVFASELSTKEALQFESVSEEVTTSPIYREVSSKQIGSSMSEAEKVVDLFEIVESVFENIKLDLVFSEYHKSELMDALKSTDGFLNTKIEILENINVNIEKKLQALINQIIMEVDSKMFTNEFSDNIKNYFESNLTQENYSKMLYDFNFVETMVLSKLETKLNNYFTKVQYKLDGFLDVLKVKIDEREEKLSVLQKEKEELSNTVNNKKDLSDIEKNKLNNEIQNLKVQIKNLKNEIKELKNNDKKIILNQIFSYEKNTMELIENSIDQKLIEKLVDNLPKELVNEIKRNYKNKEIIDDYYRKLSRTVPPKIAAKMIEQICLDATLVVDIPTSVQINISVSKELNISIDDSTEKLLETLQKLYPNVIKGIVIREGYNPKNLYESISDGTGLLDVYDAKSSVNVETGVIEIWNGKLDEKLILQSYGRLILNEVLNKRKDYKDFEYKWAEVVKSSSTITSNNAKKNLAIDFCESVASFIINPKSIETNRRNVLNDIFPNYKKGIDNKFMTTYENLSTNAAQKSFIKDNIEYLRKEEDIRSELIELSIKLNEAQNSLEKIEESISNKEKKFIEIQKLIELYLKYPKAKEKVKEYQEQYDNLSKKYYDPVRQEDINYSMRNASNITDYSYVDFSQMHLFTKGKIKGTPSEVGKSIYGAHNKNHFYDLISKYNREFTIKSVIEHPNVKGLYEIFYENSSGEKSKKTVFEPSLEQKIEEYANEAKGNIIHSVPNGKDKCDKLGITKDGVLFMFHYNDATGKIDSKYPIFPDDIVVNGNIEFNNFQLSNNKINIKLDKDIDLSVFIEENFRTLKNIIETKFKNLIRTDINANGDTIYSIDHTISFDPTTKEFYIKDLKGYDKPMASIVDVSTLDMNTGGLLSKTLNPNLSYKGFDYVVNPTSSLNNALDTIISNPISGKVLIEIENTIELNSDVISKIPDNVQIRIKGSYTESFLKTFRNPGDAIVSLKNVTYTKEELLSINEKLLEFDSGIDSNWTDMEKAKYAYDYLTNRDKFKYNPNPEGGNQERTKNYSSLTLLTVGESTCQGFAHVYQALLNRMGIECYELAGTLNEERTNKRSSNSHAFNAVVIDGKTFIVDTVRQDQSDKFNQGTGFGVNNVAQYNIFNDQVIGEKNINAHANENGTVAIDTIEVNDNYVSYDVIEELFKDEEFVDSLDEYMDAEIEQLLLQIKNVQDNGININIPTKVQDLIDRVSNNSKYDVQSQMAKSTEEITTNEDENILNYENFDEEFIDVSEDQIGGIQNLEETFETNVDINDSSIIINGNLCSFEEINSLFKEIYSFKEMLRTNTYKNVSTVELLKNIKYAQEKGITFEVNDTVQRVIDAYSNLKEGELFLNPVAIYEGENTVILEKSLIEKYGKDFIDTVIYNMSAYSKRNIDISTLREFSKEIAIKDSYGILENNLVKLENGLPIEIEFVKVNWILDYLQKGDIPSFIYDALQRFVVFIKENDIKLDLNKKANKIISKLSVVSNDMKIINMEEVLTKNQTPITAPFTIIVDGKNIKTADIIEFLENKSGWMFYRMSSKYGDINSENVDSVLDVFFEYSNELRDKYKEGLELLEQCKKSYIFEAKIDGSSKYMLLPKVFNEYNVSDLEALLKYSNKTYDKSVINKALNSDLEARLKLIETLKEFKNYIKGMEPKVEFDNSELFNLLETNVEVTNEEVKSSLQGVFENLDKYGADQGVVRKIIKSVGVNNAIEHLFGNSIETEKFLETFEEMNIDEETFKSMLLSGNTDSTISFVYSPQVDVTMFSSLIDQVKANYPDMTTKDAVRVLYLLETDESKCGGICNYATVANMIFNKYIGNESKFERDFGYPMYIETKNGKTLNDGRLLVDMFSILNEGFLIKNEDGKYSIANNSSSYVHLSFYWEKINDFLANKGVSYRFNREIDLSSSGDLMRYEDVISMIKDKLINGQNVMISGAGFDLYINDKTMEDVGGHIMTVVGLSENGNVIVDSWGLKCEIDLRKELARSGESVKINDSTKSRYISIYTYEIITESDTTSSSNIKNTEVESGLNEFGDLEMIDESNVDSNYTKVNIQGYVQEGIKNGTMIPITAEKFARIIARRGIVGEEVVTWSVDENGNSIKEKVANVEVDESTNGAGWVVTKVDENGNPIIDKNGFKNEWIISDSTFKKKYEVDNESVSIYKPKGGPQTFVEIKDNIILSQWGFEMKIAKGGYINITNESDMYGISQRDFADTYRVIENNEASSTEDFLSNNIPFDYQNIPSDLINKYGNDVTDTLIDIYENPSSLKRLIRKSYNNMSFINKIKNLIEEINYKSNSNLERIYKKLEVLDGRYIFNLNDFLKNNKEPIRLPKELYEKYGSQIKLLESISKSIINYCDMLYEPNIEQLQELKDGLLNDSVFDKTISKEVDFLVSNIDELINGNIVLNPEEALNKDAEPIFIPRDIFNSKESGCFILKDLLMSSKDNLIRFINSSNIKEFTQLKEVLELLKDNNIISNNSDIQKIYSVINELIDGKRISNVDEFIYQNESPIILSNAEIMYKEAISSRYELVTFLENISNQTLKEVQEFIEKENTVLSTELELKLHEALTEMSKGRTIINKWGYIYSNHSMISLPTELCHAYNEQNKSNYDIRTSLENICEISSLKNIDDNFFHDSEMHITLNAMKNLVDLAKEMNITDKLITYIEEATEVLSDDTLSIDEKKDKLSVLAIKNYTFDGYNEFESIYKSSRKLNKTIKEIKKLGYSDEFISKMILTYGYKSNSVKIANEFYYKAFDNLVENGMDEKDAARMISKEAQKLLDLRGTRVIATTSSGINIRIVNNPDLSHVRVNAKQIQEIMDEAEKMYSGTYLKDITIYDTFSPHNISAEKINYEDYVKNHNGNRFISAASATSTYIKIWSDFYDLNSIFHEYAHCIDWALESKFNLPDRLSKTKEWLDAIELDKKVTKLPITEYATAKSSEDFAEFIAEFKKSPVDIALKYPNRYKVASKYLNLEITKNDIDKYISSPVSLFTKMARGLKLKQNTSAIKLMSQFIKDEKIDTYGNNVNDMILNQIKNNYPNRRQILKDVKVSFIVKEIVKELDLITDDWYYSLKNYFDEKIMSKFRNTKSNAISNNNDINESLFNPFKKPTYNIEFFKETLSTGDITNLNIVDLNDLVSAIKAKKIKLSDYNLNSKSKLRLIEHGLPASKIYFLSYPCDAFVKHFGIDVLTRFEELNNDFLFGNNGINLYNIYETQFDEYTDRFKIKSESDKYLELEVLIINAIIEKGEFNHEKLLGGDFSSKYPKLFLDESAPKELKDLYYSKKIDASNKYDDKWFKYLEGKSVEGIITEQIISISESNYLDNVNEHSKSNYEYKKVLDHLAERLGMSTMEIQVILDSKVKSLVENSSLGVRRTLNSLDKILDEGKLKNQFEVKASSYGIQDYRLRFEIENEHIGVPTNLRYEDRPIYGMLLPNIEGNNLYSNYTYLKHGPGAFYSDGDGVIYIFDKEKVINNATLALGDTITHRVYATSMNDPKFFGLFEENLSNIKTKEDLEELDLTSAYNTSLNEIIYSKYYEFQLHGESTHTLDNVKEILFMKEPRDEIKEKLKNLNIPFRIISKK